MAKKKSEIKKIVVPIEWHVGDGISTRFATNLLIQSTEHETTIAFFEAMPPPLFGTPEENAAALSKLSSIRAECVARIAIPTSRLSEFAEALKMAHEKALKRKELASLIVPTNGNGDKK